MAEDAVTPAPGEPPASAPVDAASPDAAARVTKQIQALAALIAAVGTLVGAGYAFVKIFVQDGGGGSVSKTAQLTVGPASPRTSQVTFPVTIDVSGQKGHAVDVRWTLMDVERGRPVEEPGFENQEIATFKPEADRVQRVFDRFGVPAPTSTSIVFLRVRALDDAGEQIAIADSPNLSLGGTDP